MSGNHWVDTSAGGLSVAKGIIRMVPGSQCFDTDMPISLASYSQEKMMLDESMFKVIMCVV
jgi:hypothetical protein